MTADEVTKFLFENQDEKYRAFQAKLMPNVAPDKIIGVRIPILRALAKDFAKDPAVSSFLARLPHDYYDENNLHGLLICEIKDYGETVNRLDEFLPFVNNWATCDIISPKSFKKNHRALAADVVRWIDSRDTFTCRFGIEMAMSHFLDGDFDVKFCEKISQIRSDEYYVKMMVAWYFATALAKQWDAALPFVAEKRLPVWTRNKTIQKAIESWRIPDEKKTLLRGFKQ